MHDKTNKTKMKRTLLSVAMALPLLLTAQKQDFKIEGQMDQLISGKKIFLSYRDGQSNVKDSMLINNGKFSFSGSVTGPTQMILYRPKDKKEGDTDFLKFYVDKGTSKVVSTDSIKNAEFSGSKLGNEYWAYTKAFEHVSKAMSALEDQFYAATENERKDTAFVKKLQQKSIALRKEKEQIQLAYLNKVLNSYTALIIIQELTANYFDVEKITPLYNKLARDVQQTALGQTFASKIETAKKTAIGQMAPDFTQNDVNDQPVKLSDFRGKYVLLDFWASWCGPCRQENPNLVKAYHQFKDKNFTVLGISLDNPGKKENWLKAIADDQLEWTNLSDLKGWKNEVSVLYGIRSIPQNFLIGPDGKILASDLRGEALELKLSELLK